MPNDRFNKGNITSIRSQTQELVKANPKLRAKRICELLELNYAQYQSYINKLLTEFRRKSLTTLTVRMPHSSHRNKFVWSIPEWKSYRDCLVDGNYRWHESKRNKLWFFHEDRLGSVLWHNTNRIELLLSGKKDVARAKTLFCRAFLDMIGDIKELDQQFLKGEIETKHHVFKIGESLPLFNIDFFAASHGLTIYTDGSHPDSLEVSEAKPFWLDELHEIRQGFKEDMGKHMELLNQMKTMQDRLASKVNPQQEQRGKKISLALKRIHELKRIGRMRSLFK